MANEEIVKLSMELDTDAEMLLFGANDKYLDRLEKELEIEISDRDGLLWLSGSKRNVERAKRLIRDLIEVSKNESVLE